MPVGSDDTHHERTPCRLSRGAVSSEGLRYAAVGQPCRIARRLTAVALLLEGRSVSAVARAVGAQRHSVRGWWRRFRKGGAAALADRERPGRPSRLTTRQQQELLSYLEESGWPEATSQVDLGAMIKERFGVEYSKSGARKLLQGLSKERRPRASSYQPEMTRRAAF